jgi:ATP-dependent DNA helicase RecQ
VVDLLRGSGTVRDEHKALKTFGVGKDLSKDQWKGYIKELLHSRHLELQGDEFPVLKLTGSSADVLTGTKKVMLSRKLKTQVQEPEIVSSPLHAALLEELKSLRYSLARKENVPPYLVFSDSTLVELSTLLPLTLTDLGKISGFGSVKLTKYGARFLKAIQTYCQEHGHDSQMRSSQAKQAVKPKRVEKVSDSRQETLQLFKEGRNQTEIAMARNLTISTVESHLAGCIANGQLAVEQLVPAKKVKTISQALEEAGAGGLRQVKDHLGDNVTYGEIKAVIAYGEWIKKSGRRTT